MQGYWIGDLIQLGDNVGGEGQKCRFGQMMEGHEYKVEKFPLHPVVSEESPEGASNHSHNCDNSYSCLVLITSQALRQALCIYYLS